MIKHKDENNKRIRRKYDSNYAFPNTVFKCGISEVLNLQIILKSHRMQISPWFILYLNKNVHNVHFKAKRFSSYRVNLDERTISQSWINQHIHINLWFFS